MSERENSPALLLLNALNEGAPLQDILSIAAELVGNPVLFDDATDRIRAVSKDMDLERFYQQPVEVVAGERFVPSVMIERSRREGIASQIQGTPEPRRAYDPVFNCDWIFGYVAVNGAVVGNVLTRAMNRELTKDAEHIIGTLAWIISLHLQCQGENEEFSMAEMYFLYNLLNRRQVHEQNKAKWYEHMEWRPAEEMRVAVLQSNSDTVEDIEWSYYKDMINAYHPDSILCTYKNSVVLLQNGRRELSAEERENYAYSLRSYGLVCGYSRVITEVNDVYKAYRQACNAIRLGRKRDGEEALFHYSDYVLDQMVEACSKDVETLYALCHPAVFRLIRYDLEHGTEFYKTLENFFRLGNNLARLSEEMHIHRNTAYYRMSKIFQITGVDLRGDPSVLRLQFSFELLRGKNIAESRLFI